MATDACGNSTTIEMPHTKAEKTRNNMKMFCHQKMK